MAEFSKLVMGLSPPRPFPVLSMQGTALLGLPYQSPRRNTGRRQGPGGGVEKRRSGCFLHLRVAAKSSAVASSLVWAISGPLTLVSPHLSTQPLPGL